MRELIFLWLVAGFILAEDVQAAEEHFRQTKCGRSSPDSNFYVIRLEAPDGTLKRLTFNNREKGLLIFKSTSVKYWKWAADLPEFDAVNYHATQRGFGMLSANRRNREPSYEFGIVSRQCWDGLRRHIDGLVRTREMPRNSRET